MYYICAYGHFSTLLHNKDCNSVPATLAEYIKGYDYLKLQIMKDMDRICQQPGLMANVSKEWRNTWAPKIVQCGEKDASIRSLPPLLQMVDSNNPGMI